MVRQHKYGDLPTFGFKLYEGTATVSDGIAQSGGSVEDVVVYTTPIVKGDFVKIYTSSTDATPTVAKADTGDDDIIGIVKDAPVRGDAQTASGTPTTAKMRMAAVELFGVAVRNFKNDGAGAITPGQQIGFSNATPGFFEAGTPLTANIVNAICLQYTAATAEKQFPALIGYFGYMPNTA